MEQAVCPYCGDIDHGKMLCPEIKTISYHPNDQGVMCIASVEFFRPRARRVSYMPGPAGQLRVVNVGIAPVTNTCVGPDLAEGEE